MWADRRTDMTKLTVAFRSVAIAFKNSIPMRIYHCLVGSTVFFDAPVLTCRCVETLQCAEYIENILPSAYVCVLKLPSFNRCN